MKLIHLSDLHLGKRVNEFSMLEDQKYILDQITGIIEDEHPQAVIVAGDVYDKPVPPAEAVMLFDSFISRLSLMELELFIISGNHDSAERLSFGSDIMDRQGIHFAGGYDGQTHVFRMDDGYGSVAFYMLPFLKPLHVRQAHQDDEKAQAVTTYTDAMRYAIEKMDVDPSERNVCIAHQFCTNAQRSDSEEISVGGLDNVDHDVFDVFDYTALGHLHGPQNVASDRIRYSGSPLKYSFSEVSQKKSVTVIELKEKKNACCDADIRTVELRPLRDMQELRGRFGELTDKSYYKHIKCDDYMRVILTDEEDVIGALGSLRAIYPNMMRLDYDNTRSRAASVMPAAEESDSRSPLEIFSALYKEQNGKEMDEEQTELIKGLIEKVWDGQK